MPTTSHRVQHWGEPSCWSQDTLLFVPFLVFVLHVVLRYSLLDWNINTPSTVYSHITPLSTRSPPFIECFLHHVPNPSNPPSPPHLKPRPSQQTDQEQHCRRNSISSRQVTTTWRFFLPVEVVKHSSRGPIPGSGTGTPATPPNSALHPSTQAF